MHTIADFGADVALVDLAKVFQAHGVEVSPTEMSDPVSGAVRKMVRFAKGELIQVIDADPIIYRGHAHRLARYFGVPLTEVYKPDQYKSAPAPKGH